MNEVEMQSLFAAERSASPSRAYEALGRLVQVARQDSGQARRVANFCWHGTTPRKAAAGIRWTYGM